jgi:hypothetical protein
MHLLALEVAPPIFALDRVKRSFAGQHRYGLKTDISGSAKENSVIAFLDTI